MPPKQMNTRMIKEALRYKFELDHSLERTAMALKISKGVVAKYVSLSKAAGLQWSQIQAMTEAQLHARLGIVQYPVPTDRTSPQPAG
jgi:hypothetical protein